MIVAGRAMIANHVGASCVVVGKQLGDPRMTIAVRHIKLDEQRGLILVL